MEQNPTKSSYVHIYSLFIQHSQGKLSPFSTKKVDRLIKECKECEEIYYDIVDFFNEEEALSFEIFCNKEVERFRNISDKYMNKFFDNKDKNNHCEININFDDIHCCGS